MSDSDKNEGGKIILQHIVRYSIPQTPLTPYIYDLVKPIILHTMKKRILIPILALAPALLPIHAQEIAGPAYAPDLLNDITDRALMAIHEGNGEVHIAWRLLGGDDPLIAFDLYRANGAGEQKKVNHRPIRTATYYIDNGVNCAETQKYTLCDAASGKMLATYTLTPELAATPYLRIPIEPLPFDTAHRYEPNDVAVGDLDGDGEMEIVLKRVGASFACSQAGMSPGGVILEAYKLNGKRLWQVDLGINIRHGAQYLQFLVADFDGDGCAEVATKTAEGSRFADGTMIGDDNNDGITDYVNRNKSSRMYGKILEGPEFFSVLDGKTGCELARGPYIERGKVTDWGDNYGNRVDRQLGAVGYFDGKTPGIFWGRGYNGKSVMHAWSFRNRELKREWIFDTSSCDEYKAYENQGNHNIRVGDVDGDGKDEVIYGACAVDHDGKPLHNTRLGHGDAMHLTDIDPDHPGLEVWQGHEYAPAPVGSSLRDARTGEILVGFPSTDDVGRAMCADIDPRFPGCEIWSIETGGLRSCKGELIWPATPSINMAVWWDGDLTRELLDGTRIDKWNGHGMTNLFDGKQKGVVSNNGTKQNPCLIADIFGDWREEVIWRTPDNSEIRIYMTPHATPYRMPSLLEDPIYRLSMIVQNVGYNQPTHTGFYLGPDRDTQLEREFDALESQQWKEKYSEQAGKKVSSGWYLDGKKGSVTKTGDALVLNAGDEIGSEEDHVVLWTRDSYAGDIRIDYEFTRLDSLERFANLLYIQAQGSGAPGYDKEIRRWRKKRQTPRMSTYFDHMNLTHISYATFENKKDVRNPDYIRARRYLPETGNGLKGTAFAQEYLCPLLFETGEPHRITVIKQEGTVWMRIGVNGKNRYFKFDDDRLPDTQAGAIGLRQMYGRHSKYAHFRVFGK